MKILTLFLGLFLMFSCSNDAKFTAPSSAKTESEITVKFTNPISSVEKSKCWITIVKKTEPDNSWGQWQYITDQAGAVKIICPKQAGEYEIRLHDQYPKKNNHVVARQAITLQ